MNAVIDVSGLEKRFGRVRALDGLDLTVTQGDVHGFLGPNGAGKSTTMRMIMGLDRPTGGRALINGKRYAEFHSPLTEVGALLDAKAVHTGRTAYSHLLAMAATHGIPKARVHEVIGMTGLESVATKRVGGFSLGMGQRLGIAAAMLGDPATLILDEPVNGLDPEGVLWVRQFARHLASQGRTVFLSSHLMSEMAQTADHIVILGRGRVLADAPVDQILAGATRHAVRVRTPQPDELARAVAGADVAITGVEAQLFEVTGLTAAQIGEAAARNGIVLHELTPLSASLEEAYLELTQDDVEYRTEVSR